MAFSNIVIFLITIVTLSVTGVGLWTPWWFTFPFGIHQGLHSICINGACEYIFYEDTGEAIVFGNCVLCTACFLIATLLVAIATLRRINVKTLLKVAAVLSLFGSLTLFAIVGWVLGTSDWYGTLSFSAFTSLIGVGWAIFQTITLFVHSSKSSVDIAVV